MADGLNRLELFARLLPKYYDPLMSQAECAKRRGRRGTSSREHFLHLSVLLRLFVSTQSLGVSLSLSLSLCRERQVEHFARNVRVMDDAMRVLTERLGTYQRLLVGRE